MDEATVGMDEAEMARLLWLDLETCRGCGFESAASMPERALWMFLGKQGGEEAGEGSEGGFACVRCAFRCSVTHQDRDQLPLLYSQPEERLLRVLAALLKISRRKEANSTIEEQFGVPQQQIAERRRDVCRLCLGVLQDAPGDRGEPYYAEVLASMEKDIYHHFKDYSFHSMLPHASLLRESVLDIALPFACPGYRACSKVTSLVSIRRVFTWIINAHFKHAFDVDSMFCVRAILKQDELSLADLEKLMKAGNVKPSEPTKSRKARFKEKMQTRVLETRASEIIPPWGPPLPPAHEQTITNLPMNNQQIAAVLRRLDGPALVKYGLWPLSPVSNACSLSMEYEYMKLYVAGRYNKYSRSLPQTPWIMGAGRMADLSVDELISMHVRYLFQADGCVFGASGREDMDVRMLGGGRPFMIEINNARRPFQSPLEILKLQEVVNEKAEGRIFIRDLQLVTKEDCDQLKDAAETKAKSYRSLVWMAETLSEGQAAKLRALDEILLKQQTPVRVLHRRSLAVRERLVSNLSFKKVSPHFILLDMDTQAGTYVKEFVHGDLGRTRPSLASILGCDCDILQLDVKDVVLDFPPRLDTSSVPGTAVEEIDTEEGRGAIDRDLEADRASRKVDK